MGKRKLRVLIIEDSLFFQVYLKRVLDSDDYLETAGVAGTGAEALAMVQTTRPDIITLDLHLPDMDGFELLQTLIDRFDIPVVVVTSTAVASEDAIRMGARDFIEKASGSENTSPEQFALLLKLKLKTQAGESASAARTRRERAAIPASPAPAAPAPKAAPAAEPRTSVARINPAAKRGAPGIIAIGASLGGTEATLDILRELPPDMPGIVVVQHMPRGFTNAYALRLDRYCNLHVKEAHTGDAVLPGSVLIARGGDQMTVQRYDDGYRVRSINDENGEGFHPSVDVLFSSVASAAGADALGIILTGMGRDGTIGLKKMHDAGAYTIGQDEESCAIFGMPAAAYNAGAVDVLMSPREIVETLIKLCRS